ncbi:MAG: MBOAT family O-acyltransferase [Candidatus Omnitrophota bacterium]
MLFNSYPFIFIFFPVVVGVFFLAARRSHAAAAAWLGLASLFFYGYWSLKVIPILAGSICVNYVFGKKLTPAGNGRDAVRQATLVLALVANLGLLGYYKYANFFLENVNAGLGLLDIHQIKPLDIVLPIGISFFTFTQIAYLVDCWQGKVLERNFTHYLLFVTYFPHLIAGPVLHHKQMMPQFAKPEVYRPDLDKIRTALVIFTLGLSKKLLVADQLGVYADGLFKDVASNMVPMFFASWFGVLAYAFQIYFDFSGYSDMAIGLSLFFGINLPVNFNSPYKAVSMIDFWRRWHISLSTFLKDYLYVPLGGNRLGVFRRYLNLLVTMLLGGLWHGASWTFVLWGCFHGTLLAVNHAWRDFIVRKADENRLARAAGGVATFMAVCFAWVLFRADGLATVGSIYRGLLGLNGISLPFGVEKIFPKAWVGKNVIFEGFWQGAATGSASFFFLLALAGVLVWGCSNLNELPFKHVVLGKFSRAALSVVIGLFFALSVSFIAQDSPFLYFQF